MLQHVAAEAADRALLDGDQHLVLARQPARSGRCPAAWRSGRRPPWSRARGRRAPRPPQAFGEPRAEAQDARSCVPSRSDPALADLERRAARRQLDADALAARIAEGRGPVVDRRRGRDHVHQLGLVGRRHDHEARQAAEIGDVEGAGMGRRRRRRPGRRGRWRSAPAASGSRRRAPPGRRRAAGRSSRSRRTA